jgi:ribosome-associated protein
LRRPNAVPILITHWPARRRRGFPQPPGVGTAKGVRFTQRRRPQIPTRKRKVPPAVKSVLKLVETSLDADKAEEIVTVDLTTKSAIADYMVLATGRSQRQLSSMADHLVEKLKASGHSPVPVEGQAQGDWVLIDAGDVVVHLFRPEVRAHYNLEKMWGAELPELERAVGA